MIKIRLMFLMALLTLSGCATLDLDKTQYEGSPRLKVAFLQEGKAVPIDGSDDPYQVPLAKPTFTLLTPTTERPIRICASNSPVIFLYSRIASRSCFAANAGIEGQKKGALLLSPGDKHLVYPMSATENGKLYRAIQINGIDGKPGKDVYLSIFIDKDGNGAFDRKEGENFVLAFPREGAQPDRTPEEIDTVFEIYRNQIYREYKRALRKNPGLSGTLSLKFTILPSGKVSRVRAASSTLKYVVFEKRIINIVEGFNFGPKNVPAATVDYTLDMTNYSNNKPTDADKESEQE